MHTEHIEYFFAIVEFGSINKAAQALNIPPHRLGNILTNIENEFGRELVKRTKKGIILTKDGEYFLEKIQLIHDILTETKSHLSISLSEKEKIKDTIYFYFPHSLGNNYLSMVVEHFYEEYPNINIVTKQTNNVSLLLEILRDAPNPNTIVVMPIVSTESETFFDAYPDLRFGTLFRQPPVLMVSKKNKFINPNQKQVSLSTLAKIPLAVISSDNEYKRYVSESAFHSFGYIPSEIIKANNTLSYYNYINRGNCVGITAKDNINETLMREFPDLQFMTIKDKFFFDYILVHNTYKETSVAVKYFINYLFDKRKDFFDWTNGTRSIDFISFDNPHSNIL